MEVNALLDELRKYRDLMAEIESRFVRTRDSIHIAQGDESRLKRATLEITDLLNDCLGENHYSVMIANQLNEGLANFHGSPSLACVRDIGTTLDSVVTRLEREGEKVLSGQTKQGSSTAVMNTSNSSIRTKFYDHPVIFGLGLLVAGFTAGFTVRGYFLPVPNSPQVVSCTVEGLDLIEEAYLKQIGPLQSQLITLEAFASDHTLIGSYQEKYKESAERIRNDIKSLQASHQIAIESLRAKCE